MARKKRTKHCKCGKVKGTNRCRKPLRKSVCPKRRRRRRK